VPTGLVATVISDTSIRWDWDGIPDTEAPTVPTMSAPTVISDTEIDVSWSAATDDVAVTGYDLEVALDSGFSSGLVTHNLGNVLTYNATGLTASTTYYFRVRAHDAVPNNSAYSSSVNATTDAASISPDDISGLWSWLKADAIGGLSDGDPITTWQDSSAANHDATASGGNRPVYKTNILNSLPVARLTRASSQFFALPDMSALTEGEIFIVVKANAESPSNSLWLIGSDSAEMLYPFSGDSKIYDQFGTTARKTVDDPTPALTSFRIYSVYSASGDWQAYLDGVSLFSTGTNTVGFNASPLLGWGGTDFLDGDIAEVIIYDHKITGTERTNIVTYLQTKYGL
jgi:hypothetical protein